MAEAVALNRFMHAFVLPLVAGGRLHVRGLIGPGMLARFFSDGLVDATLLAEVTSHVHAHLARVGPVGRVELLPPDAIGLAAVWHNLLAMTHPDAAGRVRLRRRVRSWLTKMLEWVGAPKTAAEVASRHGVLARLGEVGRVDTDVRFWAGSAQYVGVAPPGRLLRWRTVRRVRENKVRVPLFELLERLRADANDVDLSPLVRAALSLSPLTDVALLDRPTGPLAFAWSSPSVSSLADAPLRGALVRIVLSAGSPGDRAREPLNARVRVIENATRSAAASADFPAAAARALTLFHLEMLATDAMGRGVVPTGHALAWDIVAQLGPKRASAMVGIDLARFERTLGLDTQLRPPSREAPAAALLARTGFVEVPS